MKKLFGTDGIRGKANTYPITPEIALQVGKAIAHAFGAKGHGSARVVLGKDTRLSGYMIETALTSGLVSMGMDVLSIGPLPTPAIAHLIKSMCATCGIMITASHNPSDDNGIKIFDADGFKLPDSIELDIEKQILGGEITSAHINTALLGKAYRIDDAAGRYIEFAKGSIKNRSLNGLKIVLDCANGAAYKIAPLIFQELGAEIIKIGVHPDGHNINFECGATHTDAMATLVKEHGADLGIALDGDADRVILCDENGNIVNGDRLIGMCALDFKERGRLVDNTVVTTTMTNLGFHKAMNNAGINVAVTDVGDRHVINKMREKGYNIGGEQSGHIIFMDYVTTGDGIITALHILKMILNKKKSLSELADCMEEFPQLLSNIDVKRKTPISDVPELKSIIKECDYALGKNGRVIVRYSGTENKIRVLVESSHEEDVKLWSDKIVEVVKKTLC
jgi:phosphoglucosamine mutase